MITGYLGSGKTTVLNELLRSQSGGRMAIIVNDLGSINIDASVLKKNSVVEAESKMIEMTNGCICCTLQEAFMEQIEFCNIVLLSKCDLLDREQIDELKDVIRTFQNEEAKMEDVYEDDYGITSFIYNDPRPFDYDKFLDFVSNHFPPELIRGKGYIWFKADPVHVHLFEQAGRNSSITEVSNWVASMPEDEKKATLEQYPELLETWDEEYGDRLNQLVFIGRDYDKDDILKKLRACLAV